MLSKLITYLHSQFVMYIILYYSIQPYPPLNKIARFVFQNSPQFD